MICPNCPDQIMKIMTEKSVRVGVVVGTNANGGEMREIPVNFEYECPTCGYKGTSINPVLKWRPGDPPDW